MGGGQDQSVRTDNDTAAGAHGGINAFRLGGLEIRDNRDDGGSDLGGYFDDAFLTFTQRRGHLSMSWKSGRQQNAQHGGSQNLRKNGQNSFHGEMDDDGSSKRMGDGGLGPDRERVINDYVTRAQKWHSFVWKLRGARIPRRGLSHWQTGAAWRRSLELIGGKVYVRYLKSMQYDKSGVRKNSP